MTSMTQQQYTGALVVNALHTLNEPADLQTLVSYIAQQTNRNDAEVRKSVDVALKRGVKLGFFDLLNSTYYVLCTKAAEMLGRASKKPKQEAEKTAEKTGAKPATKASSGAAANKQVTGTPSAGSTPGVMVACSACGGTHNSAKHKHHMASKKGGKRRGKAPKSGGRKKGRGKRGRR